MKAGAILAASNHSPSSYGVRDRGPLLSTWADVAYVGYRKVMMDNSKSRPKPLKYIVRLSIGNAVTNKIIDEILEHHATSLPEYPGLKFDANSREGRALIGTPNGSGPAWMLISYPDFSEQTITGVQIFRTGGAYNMLFTVGSGSNTIPDNTNCGCCCVQ